MKKKQLINPSFNYKKANYFKNKVIFLSSWITYTTTFTKSSKLCINKPFLWDFFFAKNQLMLSPGQLSMLIVSYKLKFNTFLNVFIKVF